MFVDTRISCMANKLSGKSIVSEAGSKLLVDIPLIQPGAVRLVLSCDVIHVPIAQLVEHGMEGGRPLRIEGGAQHHAAER